MTTTTPVAHVSRRSLLVSGAGLVISVALPIRTFAKASEAAAINPNAYIRIAADNAITIVMKHIEMGQGIYTGLATLAAEELDADWKKVRALAAPVDPALYGNFLQGGLQVTGASNSLPSSFDLMRRAGATARAMLVSAAAQAWQVDPAEITTMQGRLMHRPSRRSSSFGAFATAANALPVPTNVPLKLPSVYRLIGRDGPTKRLDSGDKSTGAAVYTLDIDVPGMLTVLIARPPRFGATPVSFDATETLAIPGVVAVRQLGFGFAIYAHGMWQALKGRGALKTVWNEDKAEHSGSEEMLVAYLDKTRTKGVVVGERGDVVAAFKGDGEIIEATFSFPFLAHAPMEPLDAFLVWTHDGAQARFGSQIPSQDRGLIAGVLGLAENKVEIEVMLAGGSFGRRASLYGTLATELAEVAKAIGPGRPIKFVSTREDDIRGGYYRPLAVHRMRGMVRDGAIAAWSNSVAGQSFTKGTAWESVLWKNGVDPVVAEGSADPPYHFDNFQCDLHMMYSQVTTCAFRSVGHTQSCYAVECFLDQLLHLAGKDPIAGRLELLADKPRVAGVLRAAARAAGWSGPGPVAGRAWGVAVVEVFGTSVANIAEVSLGPDGHPKVHKVWCAVDCGVAVNPDVIRAQMEGGIGFGLGHALFAEIPIEKGAAMVENFDQYRSITLAEMPAVEVIIIASAEPPTGVGEPGVPAIAPAVANAMARLSGAAPSRLPMVRGMIR